MNESQLVALLFALSCLLSVLVFHLWEVSFANEISNVEEVAPQQRSWFTSTVLVPRKQTRYFFTQTAVEQQPVDVLDTLPVMVAMPFRAVDTLWETSITATALTIKAVFFPQILTYRMIRRHIA
jgi:hypothetical protein